VCAVGLSMWFYFWFLVSGSVFLLHFAEATPEARRIDGWGPTKKRIPNPYVRWLGGLVWYPLLVVGFIPKLTLVMIFGFFLWAADLGKEGRL
jgi:hypothetical protein